MTRRISMWSGPRNVSTAMMYAWRERTDTTVWDEPMYGHYLVTTGIDHPLRDETLAAVESDHDTVFATMTEANPGTPVWFFKNMAHHLIDFDERILDRVESFVLTRDPLRMLPSLARGLGRVPTLSDTGYDYQVRIIDHLNARGRPPIVIDSTEVVRAPRSVLTQLCAALDLPFQDAMLTWPAGPKAEDGPWGRHWYGRLHKTTGFEPDTAEPGELPVELTAIYEQCAPYYERLVPYIITADGER